MQTENIKLLSIKTYLDLSQLLKVYRGDHEENRAFALKQEKKIRDNNKVMLLKWLNENIFRVTKELNSKKYLSHLSQISSTLGLFFFIVGFFIGLGLLSYNGKEPINIIYYLLVVMVVPLFSMTLSILSMFSRDGVSNFINHFFPLHWIEKLFWLLPFSKKIELPTVTFSPKLSKWLFIERIQLLSLIFSIGVLISLILMVVAKDIAFGWSTTLQLSDEKFQSILRLIALPWIDLFPNSIPSVELVKISHYFRLGENINIDMIENADKLGAWWQFLAMVTIFYAIFLRFLVWLLSRYGFKKQLERDFLRLEGVHKILREFHTPFISTKAPKQEKHLYIVEETEEQVSDVDNIYRYYDTIFGWNFSQDEILLANDAKEIRGNKIFAVGGNFSFYEDEAKAEEAREDVLIFVKSWEPPTMDFVDFLEILIDNKKVHEIQVYPLGTIGRFYQSDVKDISVWKRKIQGLKSKKVWVIDDTE